MFCVKEAVIKEKHKNVKSEEWKKWGPLRSFQSQSKLFESEATNDGSAYFSV